MVLRTCRPHEGPRPPTSLVTTRPETGPARERVGLARRSGWMARLRQARQGVVGRGHQQVTSPADRVARAAASARMAYGRLLTHRAQAIPTDRPGSALRLPRAWAWAVVQAQRERSARQLARQWLHRGQAA